jgi:hypothetical protein
MAELLGFIVIVVLAVGMGSKISKEEFNMESLLVALVCNADLCGTYPKVQKLRECLTIEDAIWLHEHNKASHE